MAKQNNNNPHQKELLNALKQEFATSVNTIYINSLGREVSFRDITVTEQKTIAKSMITNKNRPDITYDIQTAVFQTICLDKDIDFSLLTEFDRIKLMMCIYQNNYFNTDISITCQNCGKTANYKIDYDKTIENLNAVKLENEEFVTVDGDRKYTFTLNFPTVARMSDYKRYMAKDKKDNNEKDTDDSLMEFNILNSLELFIQHIKIENLSTSKVIELPVKDFSYQEYVQTLDVIPQSVLFTGNSKLSEEILTNVFSKISDSLYVPKCPYCQEKIDMLGSVAGFFQF